MAQRKQTQRGKAEDALHFARKHEQRVWWSGEHEKARAEVERLEAILEAWAQNQEEVHHEEQTKICKTKAGIYPRTSPDVAAQASTGLVVGPETPSAHRSGGE